jgi:cytochrome c-type biogenesis protein CcmH/NrfG
LAPQGRFEAATASIRLAKAIEPLSATIHASLGATLYFSGQYEEATRVLLDTLEVSEHPAMRYFLGLIYAEQHLYSDAIESLGLR